MDVGSEVVNSEGCKMLKTDEHFDFEVLTIRFELQAEK